MNGPILNGNGKFMGVGQISWIGLFALPIVLVALWIHLPPQYTKLFDTGSAPAGTLTLSTPDRTSEKDSTDVAFQAHMPPAMDPGHEFYESPEGTSVQGQSRPQAEHQSRESKDFAGQADEALGNQNKETVEHMV